MTSSLSQDKLQHSIEHLFSLGSEASGNPEAITAFQTLRHALEESRNVPAIKMQASTERHQRQINHSEIWTNFSSQQLF